MRRGRNIEVDKKSGGEEEEKEEEEEEQRKGREEELSPIFFPSGLGMRCSTIGCSAFSSMQLAGDFVPK